MRVVILGAATVAVLFVLHAFRKQPAATRQDAVASREPLSENWPLGVYSDNKEWLTFHELMVKELRDSEKQKACPIEPNPTPNPSTTPTLVPSLRGSCKRHRASSSYFMETASRSSGEAPSTAILVIARAVQRALTSSRDILGSGAAQPSQ